LTYFSELVSSSECLAYFNELERSLEYIRETPELSLDEKKRFFKSANTNLGIHYPDTVRAGLNNSPGVSALCLSGGGSLGYCEFFECNSSHAKTTLVDHFGVIKAFLDQGLLPRVITGTSAGGLIAALTCTRTDEELKVLLVPELAQRITACEDPISLWFKRFMNTGARFDSIE
jgi:predicted acylesterase/phospholipase RssA